MNALARSLGAASVAGALCLVSAIASAQTQAPPQQQSQDTTPNIFRIDWLYLQPEVGVSYADVLAISGSSNFLPNVTNSTAWGEYFGATAGMRFGLFSVGVHGDVAHYAPFDIGTVGGQVQLRLPIPWIQPYIQLGFGYAWLGSIQLNQVLSCTAAASGACNMPSVYGWSASAGVGADIWLARWITVGAELNGYLLNLTRAASPDTINYTQSGDSLGMQVVLNAHAALRF